MKFYTKSDALNYFAKNNSSGKMKLFQQDIDRAGSKIFYVASASQMLNAIKQNQYAHYYEFWSDKCKLQFGLDIDMKFTTTVLTNNDITQRINNIIMNVMNGAKLYYNHNYDIKKIIVMKNDEIEQKKENPNKISYHVVFGGLTFENYIVCKDFYMRLSKDYNMEWCDKAIYNLTCLRTCFSSKMGKCAILKPIQMIIDGQKTNSLQYCSEQDFNNFWKQTLITNIDATCRVIDKSAMKMTNSQLKIKTDSNVDVSNINLEQILFELPPEFYDDYDRWTKIGMILCNISPDNYDLWYRWSEQSDKFQSNKMKTTWASFCKEKNNKLSVGTLIKWCKDCGIIDIYKNEKKSTMSIVDNYPATEIIISQAYRQKALILHQAKLNPNYFTTYLKSNLLAIQSEKGTGKTSNLLDALFDPKNNMINDHTSILFISSRRTFGIKLLNDLREHKFKLYSEITDQQIVARRIICQIDSLMRLERDTYDFVIIDECESLARYLTSTHFTKNPKASMIVSYLDIRVKEAKHVYIMDADLSDRCLNYFSRVKDLQPDQVDVVINTFKPYTNYNIQYMSYLAWLNKIIIDVEANKKLVIPMASNSKAKDLLTKINADFPEKKVLLIHKETSDEEKLAKLLRVNEIWNTYDIVIYTPSVCMGVSFDVPNYFDNIYAYGCSNSLGAQEFCQMLHRVRQPKNNVIYLAMDYYKDFETDDLITYSTVEKMLCSNYYLYLHDLHTNLVPHKPQSRSQTFNANYANDLDDGIDVSCTKINTNVDISKHAIMYPYKEEPIYDLYVRNSLEVIANKLNFASQFFGYVKEKGYQLQHVANDAQGYAQIAQEMKNIRTDREEEVLSSTVDAIYEAPDLNKEEYLIKIRQKDEYVTEEDIAAIRRYNIVSCYKLDKVENITIAEQMTKEFIEIYHDKSKMLWFRNLTTIMPTDNQSIINKLQIMHDNNATSTYITNCYLDFTARNKYAYHYYAIELIKSTGFDIGQLGKTISQFDLETSMLGAMGWFNDNKLEIAHKFDLPKIINKDLTTIDKLSDKLKLINTIIFSQYGLRIKKLNQSTDPIKIIYGLNDDGIWEHIKYFQPINLTSRLEKQEQIHDTTELDQFID